MPIKIEHWKTHFFIMSQRSLNPKIRFVGQKVVSLACAQKFTSVISEKNRKMPIKSVKVKISKDPLRDLFINCHQGWPQWHVRLAQGTITWNTVGSQRRRKSNRPEHILWPRNLIFWLRDPWDMRKKAFFYIFFEIFIFYAFYRHFFIFSLYNSSIFFSSFRSHFFT